VQLLLNDVAVARGVPATSDGSFRGHVFIFGAVEMMQRWKCSTRLQHVREQTIMLIGYI